MSARTCAGKSTLRLLEQNLPRQVCVASLLRCQLQGVQEGNSAPGGQVCGRAHCPSQILSHPVEVQ